MVETHTERVRLQVTDEAFMPKEASGDMRVLAVSASGKTGEVEVTEEEYPDAGRRARVATLITVESLANAIKAKKPVDVVNSIERQLETYSDRIPADDITKPVFRRLAEKSATEGITVEQIRGALKDIRDLAKAA